MKVAFTKEFKSRAKKIIGLYPEKKAAMLPILYLAEREFGYISPEVEAYVGELLEVPPVKVHEVMTFYTLIAHEPIGKYHFQVCRGLSCDLCGSEKIVSHITKRLKITPGETGNDLKYTLTTVECLGACEMAPMMQLNEDFIGNLTKKGIEKILKNLK